MSKVREIKLEVTLLREMLGTCANDPEIYSTFIASKAPDGANVEEQIQAIGVEEYEEKQMTVFPRDKEGRICIFGYLLKGVFKNACSSLRNVESSYSANLTAYKKKIDGLVFIEENLVPIVGPDGDYIYTTDICQRPLRGQTAQGERIALASSETVPAGSKMQFTLLTFDDSMDDLIFEWLDYGKFNGLGQWHNSGKGAFTYEVLYDSLTDDMKSKKKQATKKGRKKKDEEAEIA